MLKFLLRIWFGKSWLWDERPIQYHNVLSLILRNSLWGIKRIWKRRWHGRTWREDLRNDKFMLGWNTQKLILLAEVFFFFEALLVFWSVKLAKSLWKRLIRNLYLACITVLCRSQNEACRQSADWNYDVQAQSFLLAPQNVSVAWLIQSPIGIE